MHTQKKMKLEQIFVGSIFKGKLLRCREVYLCVTAMLCRFIAACTCFISCLIIVINRHSPVVLHVIGDL